ncbi:hypothetical protein EII23_11720, partial [Desulfovibrio sp. OH1186_COT-070]
LPTRQAVGGFHPQSPALAVSDTTGFSRWSIHFGETIGVKKSSAQITALYAPEDLIGRQVICCMNLAPIHIGSVKSEVRILGTDSDQGVVLLQPSEKVKNGDRVF